MDRPSSSTPLRELRPHPTGSSKPGVGRRRNGKLQSCEPCRKSKLRCDHSSPCSRCLRRRIGDQCVFHPHPLTQKLSPDRLITPVSSEATPSDEPAKAPRSCSRHENSASSATSPSGTHVDPRAHPNHTAGYVGVTSFSDIFAADFADLAVDPVDDAKCQLQAAVIEKNMARSCEVLSFLQNRVLIDDFIEEFHRLEENSGLIGRPIMDTWRKGIWRVHGETLRHQRPDEIKQLVELIWDNSHILTLIPKDMTAEQWAEADTGSGLRWSVVGFMAVMVGMAALELLDSHPIFRTHRVDRKRLVNKMSEVISTCLEFYRQCEIIDLDLAWLVLGMALVPTAKKTDFSYASYRDIGELNDIVITLGLHQPPKKERPIWAVELRKRTWIAAYSREIGTATFLGRPPRLSHRFSTTEPVLDLTDEQLFLPLPELAAAVADLDSHGFNTKGHFNRSTYTRIWWNFSVFREDILDIALGKQPPQEVIERATQLHFEIERTWKAFPGSIRKIFTEKLGPQIASWQTMHLTPLQSLFQYSVHQGIKSTQLLLQLVVMRRTTTTTTTTTSTEKEAPLPPPPSSQTFNREALIRVASEMLSDLLEISQNKVIMHNYPQEVASFLGIQGLRAAAIVGVELLKQEQRLQRAAARNNNGSVSSHDGAHAAAPPTRLLPRSQTIQNLAVFASKLDAVDPSDGMSANCLQGRKVIGKILDKLLTPEYSSSGGGGGGVMNNGGGAAAGGGGGGAGAGAGTSTTAQQRQAAEVAKGSPAEQNTQPPAAPAAVATMIDSAAGDPIALQAAPDLSVDLGMSYDPMGLDIHPQDVDLMSFVYGTATQAPFIGYDHDFMEWLENMDFTT